MVISLTTTPMHVRAPAQSAQGRRKAQLALPDQRKFFNGMVSIYRHSLTWVLDNPVLTLIVLCSPSR
jgi:multidrug efflux pump